MELRLNSYLRVAAFGAALTAAAIMARPGSVSAAGSESSVPATAIVPSGSAAPASAAAPAAVKGVPAKPPARHRLRFNERDVEPANARLKLIKDDWALTEPSIWSRHVERVHAGKYVIVTGSTRYYLRVKLKSGKTAYVNQKSVDMVKSTDKLFRLTHDAAVLSNPNRWGKKLAEVHTPHSVHVVGVSLNYLKIRMRSGLEGFIPMTAVQ